MVDIAGGEFITILMRSPSSFVYLDSGAFGGGITIFVSCEAVEPKDFFTVG